MRASGYRWATAGDVNAFFGLMLDNVVNLAVLAGILIGGFGFPAALVYTRMFPGTALGVLFGDVVYTLMAVRLARRTGRSDVTAMPLGLDALPKPALAPILVFVGLDITGQSFLATPRRHIAAVVLSIFPSVAQLVLIFLSQVYNGALLAAAIDPAGTMATTGIANADFIGTVGVMIVLGHGFILTAMLWGGGVAFLIDRRISAAAAAFAACGALACFGFIHSITPAGGIYLPWNSGSTLPYHWTAAYLGFALLLLGLGRTRAFHDSPITSE